MLETAAMETNAERRRRKLTALCKERGLDVVARRAHVSKATLDQIIKGVKLPPKKDGTRSVRNLGNANAMAIEDALQLGRGWFDSDEPAPKGDRDPAAPPPKPNAKFVDSKVPTPEEWAHIEALRWLLPADRESVIKGVSERAAEQRAHTERLIGKIKKATQGHK